MMLERLLKLDTSADFDEETVDSTLESILSGRSDPIKDIPSKKKHQKVLKSEKSQLILTLNPNNGCEQ